jgi:Mrp family chromosome partitioning ATPase
MGTGRSEHTEPLDRREGGGTEPMFLAIDPSVAEVDEPTAAHDAEPEAMPAVSAHWRAATVPPTLARRGLLQTWRHVWIVALCLGLGAGAVAARGVWQLLPVQTQLYQASSVLRVDWGHPHFRDLVGDRSKPDSGDRVQAMGDLIRARTILQAALQRSAAASLPSIRENPDEAFRRIEQGLKIESNNSQVLHLQLTGENGAELPVIVNAIRTAFLKTYVDDDKKAKRSRLTELDKTYKENQKELLKTKKELAAASHPVPTESLDGGRLEEFQKQKARAEVELIAARVRLKNLETNPPEEKAPKVDDEAIDAQVESLANKDRKIRQLREDGDKLMAYIRELERNAVKPAKLPEYKDAVADHQAILLAIARRKRSLRPELEKIIHEQADEKAPQLENPLSVAKREVALYESQLKELTKRVQEQASAHKVIDEGRRTLANRRAEITEQKTQEVERLERVGQITFAEAEAIRKELNGPPAAIAMDDADHVETLPIDESRGMKLAGLSGLGVFCLVVGGISYREHLQRRIHHSDDVVHELSLPLLATTPALSDRLDLFNALVEESHPGSAFAERCQAIDGICPFVLHEAVDGQARVILVTSAMGNEGESELAAMLAYRLARAGKRTLLMDADIVSPRAHDVLGEAGDAGLCDVLRRQANWTDVIRPGQINELWFVMAGHADAMAAEAMSRDEMGPLMDQLRPEYDVIIIDASEVLTRAHGLQMGRYADAALLTIRPEISRTVSVFAAHQKLHLLSIPVLGAVYVAGSTRNIFSGVGSMMKSLGSIFGGMGSASGSAWKRFSNLQSPVAAYQPAPMPMEKQKKAA